MRYKIWFVASLVMLFPQWAVAAPFCVVIQGIMPQCMYYDAQACRQRADQLRALCEPNAAEMTLRPGAGKYCLVQSGHAAPLCAYADRTACVADARSSGGVCMDNQPASIQLDPYRNDPQRNY